MRGSIQIPLVFIVFLLMLQVAPCSCSANRPFSFEIPMNSVEVFDDETGDVPLTGKTDFDDWDNHRVTIRWNYEQAYTITDWHIYVRKGEGGFFYLGRTGDGSARQYTWTNPDIHAQFLFRVWGLYMDERNQLSMVVLSQPGAMGYNLTGGEEIKLKTIENPTDLPPGQAMVTDDLFHSRDLSGGEDWDTDSTRALALKFNPGEEEFSNTHIYISVNGADFSFLGQTGAAEICYFRFDGNGSFSQSDSWNLGPQDGVAYWFRIFALKKAGGFVLMQTGPVTFHINQTGIPPITPTPPFYPESSPTPTFFSETATFTPTPVFTFTSIPTPIPTVKTTPCSGTNPQEITIPLPGLAEGAKPLEMKLISSGTYLMGSPGNQRGRYPREGPQHRITISHDFYMGKYEVTQAQWSAIMGSNPSAFVGNPNQPVEQVSWEDCQTFIRRLNQSEQGVFRLPTEAEWEYACRAGTTERFSFGDVLDCTDTEANFCSTPDLYLWWLGNNEVNDNVNGPKEVGLKNPNPWGLFDMHGNVWEWCQDNFAPYLEDSPALTSESLRVLRGGGWDCYLKSCRSAARFFHSPQGKGSDIGFRLVREIDCKNTILETGKLLSIYPENAWNYVLYLPPEYGINGKKWPLILYLSGNGTEGIDLNTYKTRIPAGLYAKANFVVVSPQPPPSIEYWPPWDIKSVLDDVVTKQNLIDLSRIYITGFSMGGYCAWWLADTYPRFVAAIAPVAGAGNEDGSLFISPNRFISIPVWAFHGEKDNTVLLVDEEATIQAVKALGGDVALTVYPNMGHSAGPTYSDPKLYEWFLQHHLTQPWAERFIPPKAESGCSVNIKLKFYVPNEEAHDLTILEKYPQDCLIINPKVNRGILADDGKGNLTWKVTAASEILTLTYTLILPPTGLGTISLSGSYSDSGGLVGDTDRSEIPIK